MSDEVTFGADARKYFDVTDAMQRSLDHLGDRAEHAGRRMNDGLALKSEGRVAHNIGEIATALTSGASAGDVLATSISRLGESFQGSLLFSGAAVAGFALYEGLNQAADAAIKARQEIEALKTPTGNVDFLGLDKVNEHLTATSAKLKEIHDREIKESNGVAGAIVKTARRAVGTALGYGSNFDQEKQEAQDKQDLQKQASDDITKLASKTTDLVNAEKIRVLLGEHLGALAKEEIAHKERLGNIAAAEPPGTFNNAARDAENERHKTTVNLLNEQATLSNEALVHAHKLTQIDNENLSTRDEAIAKLDSEVRYRREIFDWAQRTGKQGEGLAPFAVPLEQAEAERAKFGRDSAFSDKQAVKAAKLLVEETRLQAEGKQHVAALARIHQGAEIDIAANARAGATGLADQRKELEKIQRLQEEAKELGKSPKEKYSEYLEQSEKGRLLRTAQAIEDDSSHRDRENGYFRTGGVADRDRTKGGFAEGLPYRSPAFHSAYGDKFHDLFKQRGRDFGSRTGTEERESRFDSFFSKRRKDEAPSYHAIRHEAISGAGALAQLASQKSGPGDGKNNNGDVISEIRTLVATINQLPGKVGVL
jgi:hypothetical protein